MLRRPHPIGPNQRLIGAATALAIVALKNWLKVRSGSIASVLLRTADFRSAPVNGHRQVGPAGPFRAMNRHGLPFDHLVGRAMLALMAIFRQLDPCQMLSSEKRPIMSEPA